MLKKKFSDLKIVAISDTHGLHQQLTIPEGDMIIHAGDFMTCGYKISKANEFLDWFSSLPHKTKILVAGNHDRLCEDMPSLWRAILSASPDIIYLEDSGCEMDGIKIWGTPHSKMFLNWAFNKSEEELERKFSFIPNDTNILISHAPAFGMGDKLENGKHVGEESLYNRICQLDDCMNLKLHLFGHIHNGYGMSMGMHYDRYNCSVINEQYVLQNPPHVINYEL